MSDDTDQIVVTLIKERERSYLLENQEGLQAWFPKSQISFSRRNIKTGALVADIPVWLLEARGW